MRKVLTLLTAAAVLCAAPASAPAADIDRTQILRESIGRSLALLDKAQVKFERQATCASCHNQIDPMVAARVASSRGLPINEAVYNRQKAMSAETFSLRRDLMLGQGTQAGAHVVVAANLAGLADVGFPANEDVDLAAAYLIAKQSPDGSWRTPVVRAPHGETPFSATAKAVRAIDAYAPPALRKAADDSIAKAGAWMIATSGGPDNDSLTYRLQGLVWAKAPRAEIAKAAKRLTATQRPDGGWAQEPQRESDAYSTALNLMALYRAGEKPTTSVYRRGLDYLLRTQAADGSWHVKSHALPAQPPIDSGFPYGRDQWISAWATAYAVTAMAYAIPAAG